MTAGDLSSPPWPGSSGIITGRTALGPALTLTLTLWAPPDAGAQPASAGALPAAITSSTAEDQRLREARDALGAGEAARALQLLEPGGGALEDHRALLRARAFLSLGKPELAFKALEQVPRRPERCRRPNREDHPLVSDAVRLQAAILAESEPTAAAELLGTLQPSSELLATMIDLYRRAGDEAQARAAEARLLTELPGSPEARAIAKHAKPAGVERLLGSPEARFDRVRALLDAHQNAEARAEADVLLGELPKTDPRRCELALVIGKADRKLRAYASAVRSLAAARQLCTRTKETELALRAALLEIQVRTIRGDLAIATRLAAELEAAHPGHSYVDDALMFVANTLESAGRNDEAKVLYGRIAGELGGGDQTAEAAWRLGYLALRAEDPEEATRRLEQILALPDVPRIERARARYWLARALERTQQARARALEEETVLELSFYGWLTLDRLRSSEPGRARALEAKLGAVRSGVGGAAMPGGSGAPGPAALTSTAEWSRAHRLAALGAPTYAAGELERLACEGATDEETLALALAFDAIGAHPRAQELLRARQASMLAGPARPENLGVWRALYSRPYSTEIERAAAESKVEGLFLLALSREESTFDPEIVSWAGAVGLAQLMPGTAVLAHASLKLGKLDPERLTDPGLNLRLGARVLKDGLRDFGGLEPLALAAYNGGPGVARKLSALDKAKPFDRWVEEIGIRETRKYVKRVLETWGIYRFLYDADRPFIPLPDEIGGSVSRGAPPAGG